MRKFISAALVICTVFCAICISGTGTADAAHIDAEYEDSSIHLWFDYASEKISDSDTSDTGMESFTAYMAKNEIEDIQFVLSSDSNKSGMSAELGEFKDSDGNVLEAEIFIELYHDCGSFGNVPDAIPPLSAYGAFDLAAGKSQAFLIKLTSTADTVAGDYKAMLTVRDSDGKAVKCAAVSAHVWDFALSDETACATSMNLSFQYLSNNAYGNGGVETDVLYKSYYDYLLENRVCAYYLPVSLTTRAATLYMDNPRVTAFQGDTEFAGPPSHATDYSYMKAVYKYYNGEENAHRFDKAYHFSNIVDADTPAQLDALKDYYNIMSSTLDKLKPDYSDHAFSLITTYINDIDYTLEDGTVIDQIEFYKDFINHWCVKTFAYTDKSELSVSGAKLLQPTKWDSKYGTFEERMEEMKERGDKVWWFISWDSEAPYINYYMQTDGVAQRILFWQQYDHGVEGFLYNFANFYLGDCRDPYANNITNSAYPNAHGESILIYPGAKYGLDVPVGSLRLEAMRDGIEDYQMFHMLEEAEGEGAADKYIKVMTTGMVSYSTSDKDYYETRTALGNALEELLSETVCEHDFVNGVCSICGEPDPDYVPAIPGDIDGNGYVDTKDVTALMNYLEETDVPDEAYDFNNDDAVDDRDAVYLLYHILMPARYPLNN